MPYLLIPTTVTHALLNDYRLPSSLQQYQFQGAAGATIEITQGSIYIQTMLVNGFSLGYQIINVREPVVIRYQCSGPAGVLHYILEGSMDLRQANGDKRMYWNKLQYGLSFPLEKTEINIHFKTGLHHIFQVALSTNLLSLLLRSAPTFSSLKDHQSSEGIHIAPFQLTKRTHQLIYRILQLAHQTNYEIVRLNNLILQLTDRFVKDWLQRERDSVWRQKKQVRLAEMASYIDDHLGADSKPLLTISVLAKKNKTNTFQFKKLFRQHYGFSLARFIQKKRMEKAMFLLSESSFPIVDIYLQVGYKDLSSFSRAFTNYFGYPPSRLRCS